MHVRVNRERVLQDGGINYTALAQKGREQYDRLGSGAARGQCWVVANKITG